MANVLVEYQASVDGPDDATYRARACGSEMEDGRWEGWIAFFHTGGGKVLLTSRETIERNKTDLENWASQLTLTYLEGALTRAVDRESAMSGFGHASSTPQLKGRMEAHAE